MNKDDKKRIRNEMKSMTITETQLYLWSFRVDSEQGKQFRDWLAKIVLPNLREYGIYIAGMEEMSPHQVKRVADERVEKYILRKYGIGIRHELTDVIKKVVQPSPYESWKYGKYTNIVYQTLFGMDCKPYKNKLGLSEKDNLRDNIPEKDIDLIAKAEDCLSNLITSSIIDFNELETFLKNWYKNTIN